MIATYDRSQGRPIFVGRIAADYLTLAEMAAMSDNPPSGPVPYKPPLLVAYQNADAAFFCLDHAEDRRRPYTLQTLAAWAAYTDDPDVCCDFCGRDLLDD